MAVLFFDTPLVFYLLHCVNVKLTHNLPAYLIKVPVEIFCQS